MAKGGARKDSFSQLLKENPRPTSLGSCVSSGRALYEPLVGKNIEHFVGTAHTPIGLAGPLQIHGENARGVFYVPMATTEGALVASTSRGAKVIGLSGGCHTTIVREGTIQRAPALRMSSPSEAKKLAARVNGLPRSWISEVVATKTKHGIVDYVCANAFGSWVHIKVSLNPGDAAGQNMVSKAAEAVVLQMLEKFGGPQSLGVLSVVMEGGLSGEKMATPMTLREGRGVAVTAWVDIPMEVLWDVCRVRSPAQLEELLQLLSQVFQSIGSQTTHTSLINVVAALYIATGQDVASHAESVGNAHQFMSFDRERNVLRWELCCSNLVLATLGGGTGLPSAKECLSSIGCEGVGSKPKLAEIIAATALANEISFWSAVVANEWVAAHAALQHQSKL